MSDQILILDGVLLFDTTIGNRVGAKADEAKAYVEAHWKDFKAYLGKTMAEVEEREFLDLCCNFTFPLEGCKEWLYCDSKGWVTVGIGSMIDGKNASRRSQFTYTQAGKVVKPGDDAFKAELERCKAVFDEKKKVAEDGETMGPPAEAYKSATSVYITKEQAEAVAREHVEGVLKTLRKAEGAKLELHKDRLDEDKPDPYPVLAAVVLLDMVYNLGEGRFNDKFPRCNDAIAARDWPLAAFHTFSNVGHERTAMRYALLLACARLTAPAAMGAKAAASVAGVPRPPAGAPFEIDLGEFWRQVAIYKDWDYNYKESPAHKHPKSKTAAGYTSELFKKLCGDFSMKLGTSVNADACVESDDLRRRYTNCCVFVESVILGAAHASPRREEMKKAFAKEDPETGQKLMQVVHAMLMNWNGGKTLPRPYLGMLAYVEAGLATPVLDFEKGLEPKTLYAAMTGGHHFFIIDFNKTSGHFLTLEANHREPPNTKNPAGVNWSAKDDADIPYWGGVGYRGYGRVSEVGLGIPRDWEKGHPDGNAVRGTLPEWPMLGRDKITAVVRLHVKTGPALCLPFDTPAAASPRPRYYFLSETRGRGGYFPLGAERTLHGGVHLPLEEEAAAAQPVRALAAGEIVAARFGTDDTNAKAVTLTGSHSGFVLVRHRLRLERRPDRPVKSVHMLHMHLAPLGLDARRDEELPWLQRLERERHGARVQVDPPDALQRSWLTARPTADVEKRGARLVAVNRPPVSDVGEALAALKTGEVATFAAPFLLVEKGDALGHVARPAGGQGFLHWEALAPVRGDTSELKELLDYATEWLDVPFEEVREKGTKDALLDGDELDDVLTKLPPAEAAQRPLAPDYSGSALPDLMASTRLTFALPTGGAALDYPVRIEVEDASGAMAENDVLRLPLETEPKSDGALSVDVTFSGPGSVGTGVVHVPAGTLKVLVNPVHEEVSLEKADRPPPTPAAKEPPPEQFSQVTGARWRRVRLRRPNEWTVAGVGRILGRAYPRASGPAVTAAARGIAWWDAPPPPDATPPPPKLEHPISDAGGRPVSLFTGEQAALPAGDLDSVNPITFAWLLDLLIARGLVSVVPPSDPVIDPEGLAPKVMGWLPAGGGPVQRRRAVAVADRTGQEGEVTFRAKKEGRRPFTFKGSWRDGIASGEAPHSLWGAWTLELLDAERKAVTMAGLEGPGSLTCASATPVAQEPVAAPVQQGTDFTWELRFAGDRPEALRAWLLVEKTDGTPTGLAIPVDLRPPGPPPAPGMTVEGDDYVDGDPATKLSENFSYKEFCDAAGKTPCRVSRRLVAAVQKRRTDLGKRFSPAKLDPDGRRVTIAGQADIEVEELVGPFDTLVGTFKATQLDALRAKVPPGETWHVRFAGLLLDGAPPGATETWDSLADAVVRLRMKEHELAVAHPRIGPVHLKVRRREGKEELVASAALEPADRDFWTAAAPKIFVDVAGKPAKEGSGRPDAGGSSLDDVIPLAAHVGKTLTIRAACTAKQVLLRGAEVKVDAQRSEPFEVKPKIVLAVDPHGELGARVTAKLHAWPAEEPALVRAWPKGRPKDLRGAVDYALPDPASGAGLCDADGTFRATVTFLEPGTYELEVAQAKAGTLLGGRPSARKELPLAAPAPRAGEPA